MSCQVCLAPVEDIDNEFFVGAWVVARKAHLCCECRQTIAPGLQYRREVGKDGEIFTFKTCETCVEVRDVFACGHGFVFTSLWDEMRAQAFPYLTTASECFRELTPRAKAVVMERWRAWKGLA